MPTLQDGDLLIKMQSKANLGSLSFLKEKSVRIDEIVHNEVFGRTIELMFTKISVLAGLKGVISEADKQDIASIVLSCFKELSLEDIYKAFQLERSLSYPTQTDHYSLFNAVYVSTILKKFKKWKGEMRIEHKIGLDKAPEVNITEEENSKALQSGLVRLENEFKQTGIIASSSSHIYDFLLKTGKMSSPTVEERDSIVKQAKTAVNHRKRLNRHTSNITLSNSFFSECKRIHLQLYFSKYLNVTNNEKISTKIVSAKYSTGAISRADYDLKSKEIINEITKDFDRKMLEDLITKWSMDQKQNHFLRLLKMKRKTIK